MALQPFHARWELTTRASLAETWALFSDTDRFNRAAGFGYVFEDLPQPDGTVKRLGRVRKFGLWFSWDELPWTFRVPDPSVPDEPGYLSLERVFHGGPAERITVRIEVYGGSRVVYEVNVYPRNYFGFPLVKVDFDGTTRPQLERVLGQAIAYLDGRISAFDPPPPPLTPIAKQRLADGTAQLPPGFGRNILEYLESAPEVHQDRMRPLALAAAWGRGPDETVDACLAAVRAGVLAMRWELMCPTCRGAKGSVTMLAPGSREVHCPSCNIRFDATFPENIEVLFRPSPQVRKLDVRVDCLSSPARTPFVLAQAAVGLGREATIRAPMREGGYRLWARQTGHQAVIEVSADHPAGPVAIDLGDDGFSPAVVRMAPGEGVLHVRSLREKPVLLALEDRWRPPEALTAGALLARARDLLPSDAIAPGLDVEVARGAVLVVEAGLLGASRQTEVTAALAGARRRIEDNGVHVAVFDSFAEALAASEALGRLCRVGAVLSVGNVVEIAGVPSGMTVDDALADLRRTGIGRFMMPTSQADDPEVRAALEGTNGRIKTKLGRLPRLTQLLVPIPARPPAATVAAGAVVAGRWRLERRIGGGTFGEVWASRDGDQRRAVKLLRLDRDEPVAVQRFYGEARMLARVAGDHVVRVFDYGLTQDERPYLVMELLEGHELADELQKGVVPTQRVVKLCWYFLAGLAEAHALGIIHRDVKPSNLMVLDGDKGAKVIDFGVARDFAEDERLTEKDHAPGTPRYMSPEQLENRAIDGRSDVYAVGLVMYEALTQRWPWEGAPGTKATAEVYRRLAQDPRPIGEVCPQPIPKALSDIVMKAIAREPAQRYASADDMRDALGSLLESYWR